MSNLLRRLPSPTLLVKVAQVPANDQSTSSITVGELVFGAHKARERHPALLQQIDSLLSNDIRIVPFDEASARRYGAMRAELEIRGERLDEADLRIAAIALANDLALITGNIRHFN